MVNSTSSSSTKTQTAVEAVMALQLIEGNLLDATAKYLVHQTNCVTNRAAHLAQAVFQRFPYADIYSGRTTRDLPGTIIIRGNGQDQRYVINLLGQFYPGKSKFPNSKVDGTEARFQYFLQGLRAIARLEELESIALPWRISCGAAGGDWNRYYDVIKVFAEYLEVKRKAEVFIYRLPESSNAD